MSTRLLDCRGIGAWWIFVKVSILHLQTWRHQLIRSLRHRSLIACMGFILFCKHGPHRHKSRCHHVHPFRLWLFFWWFVFCRLSGQAFSFFLFSCSSCGSFQGHPCAVSLFFRRLSGPALPFSSLWVWPSLVTLGPPRLNISELPPSTFQLHGMPSFAWSR